jgi:predicted ATPase
VHPPLAHLLGAAHDPESRERLAILTPEALREAIRNAFITWIEALASARPVVVALDDLHWADGATREVAETLLGLTDRASVALVAAFRADPSSEAWRLRLTALSEYAHRVVEVPLGPLGPGDAERLVRMLAPGLLDEAATKDVVARAEGNPLYVEELVRAVVEAGGAARERSWTIAAPGTDALPPILEGLFVARIGRLPDAARRLAQVAAIIGRTFPVRILEMVAETPDARADLSTLLKAEIVRETRRFPELECTFKHGLLQEAALATLPVSRQRELYGRVGAAFEQAFADTIDERLDVLAYYYYRSDDQRKALEYLERAAERARSLDETAQAEQLAARAAKAAARLGQT